MVEINLLETVDIDRRRSPQATATGIAAAGGTSNRRAARRGAG